jgi:hypothetical protein
MIKVRSSSFRGKPIGVNSKDLPNGANGLIHQQIFKPSFQHAFGVVFGNDGAVLHKSFGLLLKSFLGHDRPFGHPVGAMLLTEGYVGQAFQPAFRELAGWKACPTTHPATLSQQSLIIVSAIHGRECRVGTGFIVPTRLARMGPGEWWAR